MNHSSPLRAQRLSLAAALVAAAATALATAPSATAATPRAPITHVRTVAAFNWAAGEAPENITANPDGSLTLSMLGAVAGQPPLLEHMAASGARTVLVHGHQGDLITGNTRDRHGDIFFNVVSADPARSGVWKLQPGGTPRRLAALPTDGLPNGLAIDAGGHTLYVSDSHKSTVWAIPASGGPARAWVVDARLAGTKAIPLGANGLRYHNGAVWVSNLALGTVLRIPVTATGAPGHIHQVTSGLVGIDDFNFLDRHSDVVLAALNGPSEIAVIYPDGKTKVVLTSANGVASPTATAVRGTDLYITDSALAQNPHQPKLQEATINRSALTSAETS